ncbi:hypothetical protein, partial [Acinetobacter baumannii]
LSSIILSEYRLFYKKTDYSIRYKIYKKLRLSLTLFHKSFFTLILCKKKPKEDFGLFQLKTD